MLREIKDLGFEYAELSHGTRISLLPGIIDAVEAGEIKISSLHNFCPLPMGVNNSAPNLYRLSAERPAERDNAFRYTRKTVEMAARLKKPRWWPRIAALRQPGDEGIHGQTPLTSPPAARKRPNTKSYALKSAASAKPSRKNTLTAPTNCTCAG